jgi:deferrochelatase/peroxidase EfeB
MTATTNTPVELDLADIQGNLLRGYRCTHARHFAIAVDAGGNGPAFVAALISGDDQVPQVTTADEWNDKPEYCLNIGVTAPGLTALGVVDATLKTFPTAFQVGSAARSAIAAGANDWDSTGIGDIGTSAPENWILGGPANPTVHMLLSLYTDDHHVPALEERTTQLRALMAAHGITEILAHDAVAFEHGRVHFGYRDGISQPWIAGTPGTRRADLQPDALTGDFLLGRNYTNIYRGNFRNGIPAALADNATYSAFRILRQDVYAFEDFLARAAARYGFDPELVAAKIVGRWRNGVPLALAPGPFEPAELPVSALNNFDYAPTDDHPMYLDDVDGARCPIGSHIRRLNPRGALVMGQPHNHRIVRRGMPYGEELDPTAPPDDVERGLVGHFLCGDLENQFEFIQRVWVNQDISAAGLRGSRDPILGAQPPAGGKLTIRTNDTRDPVVLDDLPRLVDTRGSLYLFVPGIGGLRTLASA